MDLGGTLPTVILAVFLTQLFWRSVSTAHCSSTQSYHPAKVSEQRSVATYRFNGANADTAGLIDDFQSARISLEELN